MLRESQAHRLGQGTHLGLRKHTVRSGFQIAKLNRADLGAYQTLDRESDRTENATDDTVLAGMQHNLDQRAVAAGIKNRATVELDPTIVELHACSDQSAAHLTADATFQRGDVGLFDSYLGCMTCWLSSPSFVMRIRLPNHNPDGHVENTLVLVSTMSRKV